MGNPANLDPTFEFLSEVWFIANVKLRFFYLGQCSTVNMHMIYSPYVQMLQIRHLMHDCKGQ